MLATVLAATVLATTAFSTVLLYAPPAYAQSNDVARDVVTASYEQIRRRKYDDAINNLEGVAQLCRKDGCQAGVKADIYMALGIAVGLKGDTEQARVRFEWALGEKEAVTLDDRYATRDLRAAFKQAQQNVAQGTAASPPGAIGKLGEEQKQAIATAKQQLQTKDWEGCLQTMLVSTSMAEYAAGKLMLARCEAEGGLLLEAIRDTKSARQLAKANGDDALVTDIDAYLEELDNETPKIVLKIQSGIRDPVVKIDNTVVPADQVGKPIPHNPGTAVVEVSGKRGGQPYKFSQKLKFERRETIDLEVRSDVTPFQACLNNARTLDEKEDCDRLFNKKQGLNINGSLEVFSYNDTDNTGVVSPGISVSAVQPTDGWNIAGGAIVDLVTSASTDIVTTASPRYDDRRVGANLGGGYKFGPVTASLQGSFSYESDYFGRTVGASASTDVADKMATPYIGYSFGFDILGRAHTPFEIFKRNIYRHTINAGTSIVFNATTVGVIGGTAIIEDGDTSKPYRHVAMFSQQVVDAGLPLGASPALVARARLPLMPFEQLPITRQRYALLLRFIHRMEDATVRVSERGYYDSWGQFASSTDARLLWDVYSAAGEDSGGAGFPRLRITPHVRFHIQGPVAFWRRTYVAAPTSAEAYDLPVFRSSDRELGPLLAGTAGMGTRIGLSEAFAISVQAEAVYTRFLDHLFMTDRVGLFTATSLELDFQ